MIHEQDFVESVEDSVINILEGHRSEFPGHGAVTETLSVLATDTVCCQCYILAGGAGVELPAEAIGLWVEILPGVCSSGVGCPVL